MYQQIVVVFGLALKFRTHWVFDFTNVKRYMVTWCMGVFCLFVCFVLILFFLEICSTPQFQ